MNQFTPNTENPLTGFMRQPKIYIRLPSNGNYWPAGSIEIPDNGELAIYSMTAKDELTFKTPDALLNGQAVVDVIQSCVPAIKDAWKTPNMDIDTLLIAIRLATYGEMMEVTHTVPGTKEEVSHQIDLRVLLDQLSQEGQWEDTVSIADELICVVQPITYKDVTQSALKSFEAQRLMQSVADDAYTEEQKIDTLNRSFGFLADISFDLTLSSIQAIKTPTAIVEDREFISEFLRNTDKTITEQIQKHIARMRDLNSIKPLTFSATPEQIELGAPETYELPIRMDNSDFFVVGS